MISYVEQDGNFSFVVENPYSFEGYICDILEDDIWMHLYHPHLDEEYEMRVPKHIVEFQPILGLLITVDVYNTIGLKYNHKDKIQIKTVTLSAVDIDESVYDKIKELPDYNIE